MTLNLFEASHQLDAAYPVVITPPVEDIPEFLQRIRYVPGRPGIAELVGPTVSASAIAAAMQGSKGQFVENNWLCASPEEFTEKLSKLFATDYVCSKIVSLQAPLLPDPT